MYDSGKDKRVDDDLAKQELTKTLKQFSRDDFVSMLAHILPILAWATPPDRFIEQLHFAKQSRIVEDHNRHVDAYRKAFSRYEGKPVPKHLRPQESKMSLAIANARKAYERQTKIMTDLGLIKEKKTDGNSNQKGTECDAENVW